MAGSSQQLPAAAELGPEKENPLQRGVDHVTIALSQPRPGVYWINLR
jgi:hypothetical protein